MNRWIAAGLAIASLLVGCGGFARSGSSQADGIVLSGDFSGFLAKSPPSDCRILVDVDRNTPGQIFVFDGHPKASKAYPAGQGFPLFGVSVYPYMGPGRQYKLGPLPRTLAGSYARLATGGDLGWDTGKGSITIAEVRDDMASGTVDIPTMNPSESRAHAVSAAGAWSCSFVFRGHPTPPI